MSTNSITLKYGESTVWKVSAAGYISQTGNWTSNGADETLDIVLLEQALATLVSELDVVFGGASYDVIGTLVEDANADSFNVSADVDWITVTGSGTSSPSVTVAANTTGERTGNITVEAVYSDGSTKSVTIPVVQAAAEYTLTINATPDEAEITFA